jgi:hypothetical protein
MPTAIKCERARSFLRMHRASSLHATRTRSRAWCVTHALVAASVALATPASGENLLNSSEKSAPLSGKASASASGRDQLTVVPAVGGSTDIGVAGGYFAAFTRNQAGYTPYVWNIESAGIISFGLKNGSVDLPYIDVFGELTVPRLLGRPVDLEIRPSFTDERALYYYGMGNASSAALPSGESTSYLQYGRIHPSLLADLRFRIIDHFAAISGLRYTASWLDIPAGSRVRAA